MEEYNHPELIEELQDFLNLGCDYADTKTVVFETVNEILSKYKYINNTPIFELPEYDLLFVGDEDGNSVTLEEFVSDFYTVIVEKILNVVDTSDNIKQNLILTVKGDKLYVKYKISNAYIEIKSLGGDIDGPYDRGHYENYCTYIEEVKK